jgi:selenocysteine-specific elongation factor
MLGRLAGSGKLLSLKGRLFHPRAADEIAAAIRAQVDAYHGAHPWRRGIPKEDLKTKAFGSGDNRLYAHVVEELVRIRTVEPSGEFVRRPGFQPTLSSAETRVRDQIAAALREGRFAPPGREEIVKTVSDTAAFDRMFQVLADEGIAVEVAPGIFFHRDVLEEIKSVVAAEVERHGQITVAALRDRLQTSRKFALTVLEYFDTIRVTRRVGDARVLAMRTRSADT